MTQIVRAQHMGFCFGVRDALKAADAADAPDQTAIFGELVHNADVVSRLQNQQFQLISETSRESIPERQTVMITAHGISETRRQDLIDAGKQLIDTTCPLVRRVHEAAIGLSKRGYFVVVVGKQDHVEVLGVVEDLPQGSWAVVSSPDQAARFASENIGVICQTTMPEELGVACRDQIAELNPQATVRWINTICRPTRQRQSAVDELCRQVEVVVVVGGMNSNNTKRLAERCIALGKTAYHVQSADDVQKEWVSHVARIGLTAGTSTPDDIIDSVEARIRELVAEAPTAKRDASEKQS